MKFFIIALATVAGLVFTALRLVEARHAEVAIGYEIAAEVSTQRALQEEIRQLTIDRAALLDPRRLEPIARAAGLRTPAPDQVVVVAVEADDGP